ncbi:fumarylacetoacetate hydrolase [Sphingomonas melonis TY]|jgi:fumarylacetoacetate (FAA) hydrolase family protein|uniref:Fumarylacetoacetate hydrolase n=1 Tax=Sphingomonas melonis TY TaxID=621456 RepID=A0A175Y2H9_9SPHN|nr:MULTISPECIES: fumarylacetoacetate hydrolase family protein [Sphingomonas]AOW25146.1 fumarylacetoacetate hydrolase [Sphingomonas melonis TY]ATI57224.1 fumarylacetoacetate hydrolase [Sphingomonas melonis]KZB94791.1 fumarylacetoacetate hydrolase [Sphingomonas melonis TY]MBI0531781.1 fumarylacetoacetate hydrolase [Sphingomonas sp. TX0522]MBX8844928.1 fumarylacetoacetate hydrolase family protein [Sphingomonas melonis]
MTACVFDPADALGAEWREGRWIGRIDRGEGPCPVLVVDGIAHDMSRVAPTVAALVAAAAFDPAAGEAIGALDAIGLSVDGPVRLLSPIDLQCVKAAGVTFAVSAMERVIEERARGDSSAAAEVRGRLEGRIGGSMRAVVPGSPEAAALKQALIDEGLWSQYLEVAIGPDAEIFTKSPVLSTVGWGADVGVRSDSTWNNPEPEVVLLVDAQGKAVGATLGNDVNLRDFEGRSALLLGKAKDNNASCSLGAFVRLFDDQFTMDDVRNAEITLRIEGTDGYTLDGSSAMSQISRDPEDLKRQALSEHHYPDGFVLFLGTLFAPTQDRDVAGQGFTHKVGDTVAIATPRLGRLVNRVVHSKDAPAWEFGIGALIRNLAARGLLQ